MDDFILSFDTHSEQFQEVQLPKYREYHQRQEDPYLVVYKGCLAFFVAPGSWCYWTTIWSVWVMNEFGVVESWVKKFNGETEEKAKWPIGVTKNNEIIIYTDESMIAYNFETKMSRDLIYDSSVDSSWLNYTGSLVFLDEKNELVENASSSV